MLQKKQVLSVACLVLSICLLAGISVLSVSAAVCDKTRPLIVEAEELIARQEHFDCVMILGCRVYSDGRLSHMLEDRMKVGISLYRAGLADKLLLTGDSHEPTVYDEVSAMKRTALEAGVPEEDIITDPAGLSTYDSVTHLERLFRGKRVLIVTQTYHLYRALYIAEKLGLEAKGVSADLRPYRGRIKREVREIAARCKDAYYALAQPPAAEVIQ